MNIVVQRNSVSLTLCPRAGDPDNLNRYDLLKVIHTGISNNIIFFFTGSCNYSDFS